MLEFRENAGSLATRLDIHKRFGQRDINQWMLERIGPANDQSILDVGCGLGTQCILFSENYAQTMIAGMDISTDLLKLAREAAEERALDIAFIEGSMDQPLPFRSEQFDLLLSCFALYYARDMSFSIGEMHRVLKPDGRLFISGPAPNNKPEFFELQERLTGKPTPFMPGRMRFEPEGLPICNALFARVKHHTFENPVVFQNTKPFVDYVRASVTEDRLLWREILPDRTAVERFCDMVADEVSRIIAREGSFTMTKVVGGILAYK